MDYESYDKETAESQFSTISYSNYLRQIKDSESITIKNSSSLEQICCKSIFLIWKAIFRLYSSVKNDENLQSTNILNYINAEIAYSSSCWCLPGLETRLLSHYKRLKNFVIHIHINDPEEERKITLKQYIIRVIAIIFKYPSKTQDTWSNRMKKLLRTVIHTCDEKIVSSRISKTKSNITDESPSTVDIDSLISQLPENYSIQERRLSKEKLNFSIQSLSKQVQIEKNGLQSDLSKSLLNSIYKDSKKFKYFSSATPTSSSYLDNIQIANKRPSILLENISSLERLRTGQWEENKFERKNVRNRTGAIEKRNRVVRNMRAKTKEFNVKDTIAEEPENVKKEESDSEEISGEVSSDVSNKTEEAEDDIVSNELQELVSLNEIEKEVDSKIQFVREKKIKKKIIGRKLA